jgi:predicted metal-dependent hydrolase
LVEYLMFHEMLHMRYPVERVGHRRVVHSRAFRQAEKRFPHYERARRRLREISRGC